MALKKKEDAPAQAEKESVFEEVHEEKTVKIEQKDVTESEPMMSITEVEKLLKNSEERMAGLFNSKIQKLKLGQAKEELDADADYVASLEDDWLESPVVFFAYSINFSIHGDNKRGKLTEPPQGAVRFKPIIRTKRQGRKGEEVISVSSVKVHSKSVSDYLREHSQFGIAFFENMESALNIDSGWAQKLIEANQSIQRLSDQQVIARCRQEEMPIGTDVIKMRKALVEVIAKRAIKRNDEMQYGKLKTAIIDKKSDRQIIEKTIQ